MGKCSFTCRWSNRTGKIILTACQIARFSALIKPLLIPLYVTVFYIFKDLVGTWISSGIFCQQLSLQNDQADQQIPSGTCTWYDIYMYMVNLEQLKANYNYFHFHFAWKQKRTETTPSVHEQYCNIFILYRCILILRTKKVTNTLLSCIYTCSSPGSTLFNTAPVL